MLKKDIQDIEIDLLLSGIQARYGYDFSHYSMSSLQRRLENARMHAGAKRLSELLDFLLHDKRMFNDFLKSMSVTVTEMFRDPDFYKALRQKVVPSLKTFPFVKIWHAGCATGEEVYSMAILLQEEHFLGRARLYATDFNKQALSRAEEAVYAESRLAEYASNYVKACGTANFSDYYSVGYGRIKFKDALKERITFSYHNLVTDGIFGEMNLICCRNVLIYFDRTLQDRVLTLFSDSLRHGGFLCLGSKESLNFAAVREQFDTVDSQQKIYRKRGAIV